MTEIRTRDRDNASSVSVSEDFFIAVEQLHEELDATRSAKEIVAVAIQHTSRGPSAVNAAVTVSFLSRCGELIGGHVAMDKSEFTRMERLDRAWESSPKGKAFFEAVSRELTGSEGHDNRLLSDVAILIILKEEFPKLPLNDAIKAFGKLSAVSEPIGKPMVATPE